MESTTAARRGRGTADPDVVAGTAAGTAGEKLPSALPPPPAQAFEWIQHGDASARRRARAHITRGFRRQKAEEAKKNSEKGKESESREDKGEGSTEIPRADDDELASDPAVSKENETLHSKPYAGARRSSRALALHPTLGSGRRDPFTSLPVDLGPGARALLDHFLSGVAPLSYQLDARANFSHVKLLSFQAALSSPPAFHVLLSAAASDIAALHGKQDSKDAIVHRGMAISGVSNSLIRGDAGNRLTDESIAGVALLAGNELLFGDPKTFNTHMHGLASIVKARGGLESIRESSPQLYSIISWFDFSGACNLLSRRRFEALSPDPLRSPVASSSSTSSSSSPPSSAEMPISPTSPSEPLSPDPHGVPTAILFSLPDGYDLRQYIRSVFNALQTLTQLPRTDPSTTPPSHPQAAPPSSAAAITASFDSELYRSICLPDQDGNRSRRRHIVQAHQFLVLLYSTFLSHFTPSSPAGLVQRFCSQLETALHSQSLACSAWGATVASLCSSVLTKGGGTETLDTRVEILIDRAMVLDWAEWRYIKQALLQFFLDNELCDGRLQGLWKTRLGYAAGEEIPIP